MKIILAILLIGLLPLSAFSQDRRIGASSNQKSPFLNLNKYQMELIINYSDSVVRLFSKNIKNTDIVYKSEEFKLLVDPAADKKSAIIFDEVKEEDRKGYFKLDVVSNKLTYYYYVEKPRTSSQAVSNDSRFIFAQPFTYTCKDILHDPRHTAATKEAMEKKQKQYKCSSIGILID